MKFRAECGTPYPILHRMKFPRTILGLLLTIVFAVAAGCSKPKDVKSIVESGDRHFDKREFEAAKIQYINALRLDQTNTHVMMRLGRVLFEQGQIQMAYPLLVRSRDSHPDEIPIREALAMIYMGAGTNLWRAEVDAILQRQATNETAIMTLLRGASSPEAITEFTNTLSALRARNGDRAVFCIADSELARRQGDKDGAMRALRRAVELEPQSVTALGSLGLSLLAEGKRDEGLALLANAADNSPPYGAARLRYAQALLANGKVDDAIKVLDQMNAKAPEVLLAWSTRAEVALGRKEYSEARRLLDRVLVQSPADPPALRLRAQVDLAENKPADAVKNLETVAKSLPRSSEVQYQLGVANLLNKDQNAAVANLREAIRLDPSAINAGMLLSELEVARGGASEAISLLNGIVRRVPELAQARMLLARAYRATGRLDEAIDIYAAMQKQSPTNPMPIFQLGLVLRQKNRDSEARAAFETCARLTPTDTAPVQQLIGLDMEAKDYASALRRVDDLGKRDPNASVPWVMRGSILNVQGKTAEAEAAFKKALDLEPESQQALLALAQLYATAGKREEALAELKRAIDKEPTNVGALTLTGMLQSEAGRHEEARRAYEKALAAQPNSVLVLNNLANTLAERINNVEAGYAHATKARQLAPKSPVVADTLGWIEFQRKNYSQALRLLFEAAENLGNVPEVQYHLGMAHYMMGQESPALVAFQQAVKGPANFNGKNVASNYLAMLGELASTNSQAIIQRLEERRTQQPDDLIAITRLAKAYASTGSPDKAREAFEAARKVNPSSIDATLGLATLYSTQLNDHAKALELARSARNLASDDFRVAATVGRIAYLAGDHTYAYSLLDNSSRRLTNAPQVTLDFARAAYGVGRISEATNALASLARTVAGPIASHAQTFLQLLAAGTAPVNELANIQQIADQVLTQEPDHLAALYARAVVADRNGDFDEARSRYEGILAKFPSFAPASRDLAVLYLDRLGDDTKASTHANKAREVLQRDDLLTALLGKIASRKGDHRFATQLLTDAARTRPNDAEVYYYLGVSQIGIKQADAGKASLKKAIALAPQAKFVAEAQRLLDEKTPQ